MAELWTGKHERGFAQLRCDACEVEACRAEPLQPFVGTGFMPSDHQGILLRSQGDPVLYLSNPKGVSRSDRRAQLDALSVLNGEHHKSFGDPEVLARLRQHEMAYRMQTSVPELMDCVEGTGVHF